MKKVNLTKAVLSTLFGLLLSTSFAEAGMVDFKCQDNCLKRGYSYGYCRSLCSYGDDNIYGEDDDRNNKRKIIDFKCQDDCLRKGYSFGYCSSACSY